MDSTSVHQGERSRPPYPRTASRSSTSTSNTRITTQTHNSGGSSSPQLSHAHPSYRFNHTGSTRPNATSPTLTTRPTPQLSREASSESNRPSAMSSFLQEKLQRERQSDLYKTSTASPSSKNGNMSASLELGRAAQSSPSRDSSTHRPQSSSGDSGNGKKGHGVKEMEQVISSLHKQNFDLKLELYHRRERQTALEDRVEGLEADKTQVEEMNDKLMGELEKRDKAIEEAVAMIVTLEAKIDQLAQERRMVRQIEAEAMFRTPDFGADYEYIRPSREIDTTHPDEEARALTRMPSFLSERTDNTENLRNVYLHGRSSIMSLPRASEQPEGLASPSLSVLSESSFVSVYGNKSQDRTLTLHLTEPLSLDGGASKSGSSMEVPRPRTATGRSGSITKSTSGSSSRTNNGQFNSISDVVGQGSPLQRLEKMDPNYARRPQSSGRDMSTMNSSKASKSPARRKTRDEKREGLRRVTTEVSGGVRLQEHALPPTPDTMSTSTLRRFRNSNDTLEGEARSQMPTQPLLADKLPEPPAGVPLQPTSSTAPKLLDLSINKYPENIAAIRRPRSADETTVSQHRRGNDWDYDSDDDGQSFRSSLDIWMRQGGSKQEADGRGSPDLFGFPTSASRGAWAMDAMFGPGSTYAGGAQVMGSGQAMDELFSAQGKAEHNGPPPPGRRSSYHARTGSSSATPTMTSQTQKPETPKHKSPQRRAQRQHARGASIDARSRSVSHSATPYAPPPPAMETQQATQDKRGHYPPLSGTGGARAGLNRLFRRSLGGAADAGLPPRSPSAPIEPRTDRSVLPPPPSQDKSTMGTLSWVNRNGALDDERSGATPPPIMRNPRHQRGDSFTEKQDAQEPSTPVEGVYPQAMEVNPPISPAGGPQQQRRKWLPGFGRTSSLRNRTG
ncbi:hypothetical protein CC79DRAFT_1069749 [Sarocladium strictum]